MNEIKCPLYLESLFLVLANVCQDSDCGNPFVDPSAKVVVGADGFELCTVIWQLPTSFTEELIPPCFILGEKIKI